MTTFRFLALVAFLCAVPTVTGRRTTDKKNAQAAHSTEHHEKKADNEKAEAVHVTEHYQKKADAKLPRCSLECLFEDDGSCSGDTTGWCKDNCEVAKEGPYKGSCVAKEVHVEDKKQQDEGKVDDQADELEELEEDKKCFPADASLVTPTGFKKMSELRVGDIVQAVNGAGQTFFDEVYFFGHARSSTKAEYVALKFAETSLELSDRHFLPTCPEHGVVCDWAQHVHSYAKDVQVGDYVWRAHGEEVDLQMVLESSMVVKEGFFNPYTLSGKVVVNGVVASAHSEWLLDEWMPSLWTRYLPATYQAMFLPGRWLYQSVGPSAADVLDVNNPQHASSKHGYGPEFLAAFAGLCVSVVLAFPFKR